MIILGISEAHEAHACLVKDGELLGVMAEERLSRIKTDSRYLRRAIDAPFKMTGIDRAPRSTRWPSPLAEARSGRYPGELRLSSTCANQPNLCLRLFWDCRCRTKP